MLGGLTVPLSWGVAVPPDDYDHWAPESEEGVQADDQVVDPLNSPLDAGGLDEWGEWGAWQGEAEPRFEVPRTSGVIPHSPAAG